MNVLIKFAHTLVKTWSNRGQVCNCVMPQKKSIQIYTIQEFQSVIVNTALLFYAVNKNERKFTENESERGLRRGPFHDQRVRSEDELGVAAVVETWAGEDEEAGGVYSKKRVWSGFEQLQPVASLLLLSMTISLGLGSTADHLVSRASTTPFLGQMGLSTGRRGFNETIQIIVFFY